MTKKQLDKERVITELTKDSVFFRDAHRKKQKSTIHSAPLSDETPKPPQPVVPPKPRTDRVTDSQTKLVTELQSNRLTDFNDYEVPDFRELQRIELRLTWEQDDYLDKMQRSISRAMPEGERSDPNYKRITKNSIIRALVEIARRLELTVDASRFKNERDLLEAIVEIFKSKLTNSQTDRVTDLESNKVSE